MDEYFSKLECSCCGRAKNSKTITIISGHYHRTKKDGPPFNWCAWHAGPWRDKFIETQGCAGACNPNLDAKVFDRKTGQLIETWSIKDGQFHIEPNPNYEPEKDSGGARLPQSDAADHASDRG